MSAVQHDVAGRAVVGVVRGPRVSPEALWGAVLVLPCLPVFAFFVAYQSSTSGSCP